MYRFKKSLIALVGLISLWTIATIAMPHIGYGSNPPAAPTSQTQNVKVVNALGEPLPVQGSVQATQTGTWNVGINGTPNVNVANIPTQVPFHQRLIAAERNGLCMSEFTTIQGKTTVIRSISAQISVETGQPILGLAMNIEYVPFDGQQGPEFGVFHFAPARGPVAVSGMDTYVANETTDLRIPGGIRLFVGMLANPSCRTDVAFYGYTE